MYYGVTVRREQKELHTSRIIVNNIQWIKNSLGENLICKTCKLKTACQHYFSFVPCCYLTFDFFQLFYIYLISFVIFASQEFPIHSSPPFGARLLFSLTDKNNLWLRKWPSSSACPFPINHCFP